MNEPFATSRGILVRDCEHQIEAAIREWTIRSSHVRKAFQEELHAKRVLSLSNGVIGVMHASSLAVSAIGAGLAAALDTNPKHAIKQTDRLLSNAGVSPWELFAQWVPHALGERTEAAIAIDWTDFDADDQVTCAAHLITSHGRTTALAWKTIRKSELRGQRTEVEDQLIDRLHEVMRGSLCVTLSSTWKSKGSLVRRITTRATTTIGACA